MDSLKHYIVNGDLKPGTRLPTERALVATMGISRNVLREALKALEAIGLIEIRVGDGMYVCDFDYASVMNHISFAISRTRHQLKSFMYAREVIEVGAMEYVIERVTDEDIDNLQKMLAGYDGMITYEQNAQVDQAFHQALLAISGNPVLAEFAQFLGQFFIEVLYYRGQGRYTTTADDHASIIETLRARDVEAAKMAMHEHVLSWEPYLEVDPAKLGGGQTIVKTELLPGGDPNEGRVPR